MILPASNQQQLQSQGVVSFTVFSGMRKVLNRKADNERAGSTNYCPYKALSNIVDASVQDSMLMFEVMDFSSPITDEQYPFAEVVLNGIPMKVDYNSLDRYGKLEALANFESKIRYLGFACNTTIARIDAPMLMDHNVSQCAGTKSVQNTGPFPIKPGQLIMARVPDPERTEPQLPVDGSFHRTHTTRFPELIAVENNDRPVLSRAHIDCLLKFADVQKMAETLKNYPSGPTSEGDHQKEYYKALQDGMSRIAIMAITALSSQIQGVSLNGCEPNNWFDLHITGPATQNMLMNGMLCDNLNKN